MRIQRSTILMTLAFASLALSACDDDDDDNGTNPNTQATVRFVNAMTGGTGSLTITPSGTSQTETVAYQNAGSCRRLTPGDRSFAITTTGSSNTLVSVPTQNLTAGTRYTVVATGSTTAPTATFFTDTYATPSSGRAKLRIVNATGILSPFDVYIGTPGTPLGIVNEQNVGFNTSSTYIDVPAGSTQVRVTTPGAQTVLGTSADFTLNSGEVRTLVFTPSATVGGTFSSFFVPQC